MATKTLTHVDYTVGWICALPKEQTAALAMLDEKHAELSKQQNDPNVYTLGSIGRHNVVIACLPMGMIGNNKAANVAAHMISTFPSIKFGLMVGIGGGVPPNVRLGDVVVSKPVSEYGGVVQWDFGKAEQGGTFQRTGALNNPPSALLAALTKMESKHDMEGSEIPQYLEELKMKWPKLIAKYIKSDSLEDVLFAANHTHRHQTTWQAILQILFQILWGKLLVLFKYLLGSAFAPERSRHEDGRTPDVGEEKEDDCRFCDKTKAIKRRPRDMRVHYGLIASGNQVIKDAIRRDDINEKLGGNVLCFEMEAAGLMNDFPCLVIRGICDYADSHKNKNWQEHAAAVAAAFAKEFLSVVPAQEVDMMPTIKSLHEGIEKISKDVGDIKQRQIVQEENSEQQQRSQVHQTILNWLTRTDYYSQQSDFIRRRQAGTGEWLLASNKFQAWADQPKQILFCPGIPGAGKTITTSIVVQHLQRKFRDDVSVGIAILYCNFRQHQNQHPEDLLLSLLKQIIWGTPSVPICVEQLYEDHHRKGTRPTFDEITDALFSVIRNFSLTFIIIDALDECIISDGARSKFMSTIFKLHAQTRANIFATSRFIPDIEKEFKKRGADLLEIRASDKDMQRYLDGHRSQLRSFVLEDPELEKIVKDTIVKAADGMFLLAKLHLDSLEDKVNLAQIKHALEKLPRGSDAYDQAYEEAMERVQGQKRGFRALAIQALLWITRTKRPLAKLELQHALATTDNASSIVKGNITGIELIISVCAGLITVDEESGIIRLIHYTTQEFFERTQESYFGNVQENIARTCVTYLSFDEFGSGPCDTNKGFKARTRKSPLYNYAARYWGDHTKGTLFEEEASVLSFLESDTKVAAASQAMFAVKRHPHDTRYSQKYPKGTTGLHLAAYFGLSSISAILLKRGCRQNVQNRYWWTPLWIAASAGHDAIVQLLLSQNNNDHEIGDTTYNRSPLKIAAEKGHAKVVGILLEKSNANPNSTSTFMKRTPLSLAALRGHEDVVKRLLAWKGVRADVKDRFGQTPLWLAASNGHKAVVELLLGIDGVNPETLDSVCYQTPLSAAAANGHEDVVKLLITSGGVDPNQKNYNGQTPLYLASENGHESVVKFLLTLDYIDQDATDTHGTTPLCAAAARGHATIVESLLSSGADPKSKDNYGWTPFLWASANGQWSAMQLLQAMDDVRNDEPKQDHFGKIPRRDINVKSEGRQDGSTLENYHIAWICALPVEIAATRGMMDEIHVDLTRHPEDGYIYSLGRMSEHNVVFACPQTQPADRVSLTEIGNRITRTFTSIRVALLVGIGGGAPTEENDIRLGDVVIDLSRGQRPGVYHAHSKLDIHPPRAFLTAVSALELDHMIGKCLIPAYLSEMRVKHPCMSANFTSCLKYPDQLFKAGYDHVNASAKCENCDVTQLIARPLRIDNEPVTHYGLIFSRTRILHSGMRDWYSTEFGALCLETQAASWNADFPALLIRGTSSYADSHANYYWQEYAAATVAAYAKGLLKMVGLEDILAMQAVTMITPSPKS